MTNSTNTDRSFQGFASYETWNIALWITNDQNLYEFAKQGFADYLTFAQCLLEKSTFISTPDGVDFISNALDYKHLDEIIYDL